MEPATGGNGIGLDRSGGLGFGLLVLAAVACSTTVHTAPQGLVEAGGQSSSATAGSSKGSEQRSTGLAGGAVNTGGVDAAGGAASTGGVDAAGGAANAGGVDAAGGAANAGGVDAAGGAVNTGGMDAGGGANTGGMDAAGGANAGGMDAAGGAVNTGGMDAAGGAVDTGGVSTGGVSTGGVSTGGVSTGGVSTGGVSTGGVSTGGVSTGGVGGCDPTKPFGAWTQIVPSTTNSSETSISVAADGLSAIVGVRPDYTDGSTSYDLRRYTRQATNTAFGNPADIPGAANVNTSDHEGQAQLTRDGLSLFFTRTVSGGSSAIYVARRTSTSGTFSTATALDSTTVNFTSVIGASWMSPDNRYFYWIVEDDSFGIYRADVDGDVFSNRIGMAQVNSIGPIMAPAFTDDQRTIYVASKGSGTTATTLEQVWRSTRSSANVTFATPVPVDELRDDMTRTYPQDVSPDGCIIYLAKTLNGNTQARHVYQAVKDR